jgi:uncharacterized membrane protein YdjX (TVP38/TMEM64 family)
MEHTFGTFAKELKQDISTYVEMRLEYSKLIAYEKISKLIGASSSLILIVFFAFFGFFFLSFTMGYYLGQVTGSLALGFGIITGIYLILLVIIGLSKKKIEAIISNRVAAILIEDDDERSKEE